MNDQTLPTTVPDQEVFQRVWNRVMAGREDQVSPIETVSSTPVPMSMPEVTQAERWVDGDMSCSYLEALEKAMPSARMPADRPGNDLSIMEPAPPADSLCSTKLRQQTLEALEAWQFYRYLARRTRGSTARILGSLASDQHQLARKLAAAYFLHPLPTSSAPRFPAAGRPTPLWICPCRARRSSS